MQPDIERAKTSTPLKCSAHQIHTLINSNQLLSTDSLFSCYLETLFKEKPEENPALSAGKFCGSKHTILLDELPYIIFTIFKTFPLK